jgi:hypothetical protein
MVVAGGQASRKGGQATILDKRSKCMIVWGRQQGLWWHAAQLLQLLPPLLPSMYRCTNWTTALTATWPQEQWTDDRALPACASRRLNMHLLLQSDVPYKPPEHQTWPARQPGDANAAAVVRATGHACPTNGTSPCHNCHHTGAACYNLGMKCVCSLRRRAQVRVPGACTRMRGAPGKGFTSCPRPPKHRGSPSRARGTVVLLCQRPHVKPVHSEQLLST